MEAHELVHKVLETFSGLAIKLERITDKSAEWFRSHGREPKTRNPLQSGNVSPVTHYLQYLRQFEAAQDGAGKMLNRRVFYALEAEFCGEDADCSQNSLHAGVLKESFDVLKLLNESDFAELSAPQLAAIEEEGAQLRDAAADFISHVRALRQTRKLGK